MPDQDRFTRILERRAARLGVPVGELLRNQHDRVPRFLLAVQKRAQELGTTSSRLLVSVKRCALATRQIKSW